MFFEGTTAETDAVLRAMKHVATAGGTQALSDTDRVALTTGVASTRGDELTGDTLAADWNFWTHVDEPLEAVRHAMGVPPVDPADAADGEYPDWYEPTA